MPEQRIEFEIVNIKKVVARKEAGTQTTWIVALKPLDSEQKHVLSFKFGDDDDMTTFFDGKVPGIGGRHDVVLKTPQQTIEKFAEAKK